jgi:hypothetical protein
MVFDVADAAAPWRAGERDPGRGFACPQRVHRGGPRALHVALVTLGQLVKAGKHGSSG